MENNWVVNKVEVFKSQWNAVLKNNHQFKLILQHKVEFSLGMNKNEIIKNKLAIHMTNQVCRCVCVCVEDYEPGIRLENISAVHHRPLCGDGEPVCTIHSE